MRESQKYRTLSQQIIGLLRVVALLRPAWRQLARPLTITLIASALGMMTPLLSKALVDVAYPRRDLSLVTALVIATLGAAVGSAILNALRAYVSSLISSELLGRISLLFFERLLNLPIRFYGQRQVGEILSRFSDVRGAFANVTTLSTGLLVNGFYLLLVPPALFLLDWQLAGVSLVFLPISSGLSLYSTSRLIGSWRLTSEASAALNAVHAETLQNIRVVKSMGLELEFVDRARTAWHRLLTLQEFTYSRSQAYAVAIAIVNAISSSVFLYVGWRRVVGGELSLGAFFAMSTYIGFIIAPISYFAGISTSLQQASISIERMFEYLDAEPELQIELQGEIKTSPLRAMRSIVLRDVCLNYGNNSPALSAVNLSIAGGSSTAVVGPSGAGKSTLLRVIGRLETPDRGEVVVGGISAAAIPLRHYRRSLGMVNQEGGLFRATLRENLTLGNITDTRRLASAIEICGVDAVLSRLPKGLDHEIGEGGMTLSGGERQRIVIARAILRDVSLYLFDEATSSLDIPSEAILIRNLLSYLEDRTVILVTHRLHWLHLVAQVCFVTNGEVNGFGPHAELLASHNTYRTYHSTFAA